VFYTKLDFSPVKYEGFYVDSKNRGEAGIIYSKVQYLFKARRDESMLILNASHEWRKE